jgi:hypothetical protein
MTNDIEFAPDGYMSLGCSTPTGMSAEEISLTLFEINNDISSIAMPPIGRVESTLVAYNPRYEDIDDYRHFNVEFGSNATVEQIQEAVKIVSDAFRRVLESR